jgi:hypothetical protein
MRTQAMYGFMLGLLTVLSGAVFNPAHAQVDERCSSYLAAVAPAKGSPSVVPESYLSDVNVAVPCLMQIVDRLGGQIRSPDFELDTKNRFLSASAALRSIMTRLDAADKLSGGASSAGLSKFITLFRERNNGNVISALAYGTRNEDKDLRLSATLLLGNVIDNRFVCIPLTHLNDPELLNGPSPLNGRANLLGIISVVAPWAYKENYENIEKTRNYLYGKIDRNDPNLKTTVAILENILTRLKSQKDSSNKAIPLDPAVSQFCQKYVQEYSPKLSTPENVAY